MLARSVIRLDKSFGRDHDGAGFTYWLAGGGVKAGVRQGATVELGWFAAELRKTRGQDSLM